MRSLCAALLAVFLASPAGATDPPDAQTRGQIRTLMTQARLLAKGFADMTQAPSGAGAYAPAKEFLAKVRQTVKNPPAGFSAALARADISAQPPDGYKDLPDALRHLADEGDALFADGPGGVEGNGPHAGQPGQVAYLNQALGQGHGLGTTQASLVVGAGNRVRAAFATKEAQAIPGGGGATVVAANGRGPKTAPTQTPPRRGLDDDEVPWTIPGRPDFSISYAPTNWALLTAPLSQASRAAVSPLSPRFGQDGVSAMANQAVSRTFMGLSGMAGVMPPQTPSVGEITAPKTNSAIPFGWFDARERNGRQVGWYGGGVNLSAADWAGFGFKGQTDGRGSSRLSTSLTLNGVMLNAGYTTSAFGNKTISGGLSTTALSTPDYKIQLDLGLHESLAADFTGSRPRTVGAYANLGVENDGVYTGLEASGSTARTAEGRPDLRLMARIAGKGHPFDGLALAVGAVGNALFGD